MNGLIPDTRTYGLLKDLRFAVRGGRVPRWVKTIADLLRATAVIRTVPDGRVASGTFLFGRRNRIRRFARYVAKRTPAADALDIAIGHAVVVIVGVEIVGFAVFVDVRRAVGRGEGGLSAPVSQVLVDDAGLARLVDSGQDRVAVTLDAPVDITALAVAVAVVAVS